MNVPVAANELTKIIDGEEYIVSQVRICRKCKMTLPLDPALWANVEEYVDKPNRIILWQHKDCNIGNYPPSSKRLTGARIMTPEEKEKFLYAGGTPRF